MSLRVITLDGPAGSGKSTVARQIAKRLGYTFLDTGALYRAAALVIDKEGCDIHNDSACCAALKKADITISQGRTYVNGRDVSEAIRTHRISELSSVIAVHPSVRKLMVDIQRSFKGSDSLVAEGRDTGSVVFPDADIKFFLDASPEERARRRHAESEAKGMDSDYSRVLIDIKSRDHRDSSRTASPLMIPENAYVVDTTHLDVSGVVDKVLEIIRDKLAD